MNQLDPELKRLIRWSRAADADAATEAPYGMAVRIASRWRAMVVQSETEPAWWRQFQVTAAWLSVAILVIGASVWTSRLETDLGAYTLTPAYQLIAKNIAP
ncbi:MAG TPA: hypothetical protein DCY13_19350 [Verrucomicrobiales bacterium]|nr:hypothetical protein [Verrucomicrobiales bacterium]